MKNFYFCCCLLFFMPLGAQNLQQLDFHTLDSMSKIPFGKGDYKACLPYIEAMREKAGQLYGEKDSLYALYTYQVGFLYAEIGDDKTAEKLYLLAKDIRAKLFGEAHPDYARSLNNLAVLYQENGDYEKAEALFLQASSTLLKTEGEKSASYATSLSNLAIMYQRAQNLEKAEPLLLNASDILKNTLGDDSREYITSLSNLGVFYRKQERLDKAEQYFSTALNMAQRESFRNTGLHAVCLNNLGLLLLKKGRLESVENILINAKNIRLKVFGKNHPEYSEALNSLAGYYETTGNKKTAYELFSEATQLRIEKFGDKHPLVAASENNLTQHFLGTSQLDSAYFYALKSIVALSPSLGATFMEHPDFSKLQNLEDYLSFDILNRCLSSLLSVLKAKATANKEKAYWEQYLQLSKAAIAINNKLQHRIMNEVDKLRNLALNGDYIKNALETTVFLEKEGYKEDAFRLADLNKSVLLAEALQGTKARNLGDLPDSLALAETMFQKRLELLKKRQLEARSTEEKEVIAKERSILQLEMEAFLTALKNKYPKYHALKYADLSVKVSEIQSALNKNSLMLQYFMADSMLYTFALSADKVDLFQTVIKAKDLKKYIANFSKALKDYEAIKTKPQEAFRSYTESAFLLYELLLKSPLAKAADIKQLIIIPDGELAHIPFEVLLREKAQTGQPYGNLYYLLRDYTIVYNYSAALWQENKMVKRGYNNGKIFAAAADYRLKINTTKEGNRSNVYRNMRDVLQPLPAARAEVEALEKLYEGFFAFDTKASEKVFKEKAGAYSIIHLAMHGLLDKKSPILSSLAFTEDGDSVENNFLQAYEISKMELNADLVVLSACETGYGKFEKGNGTASLARAFMYAGVPSLVVSLWQVNDASTSQIMQLFYKNLAKGMNKAEALQKAKLEYINAAVGSTHALALQQHPAYWAPFVIIGDDKPISVATKGMGILWWALGAVGLLALVAGVFIMRRKSKEA